MSKSVWIQTISINLIKPFLFHCCKIWNLVPDPSTCLIVFAFINLKFSSILSMLTPFVSIKKMKLIAVGETFANWHGLFEIGGTWLMIKLLVHAQMELHLLNFSHLVSLTVPSNYDISLIILFLFDWNKKTLSIVLVQILCPNNLIKIIPEG